MIDFQHFLACATCRVDPGSAINQASNGAVFVMLGVMTVVFSGFMAVVISFVRKQRAFGRQMEAAAAASPPSATASA